MVPAVTQAQALTTSLEQQQQQQPQQLPQSLVAGKQQFFNPSKPSQGQALEPSPGNKFSKSDVPDLVRPAAA